ncbi:DNA alkylation repair protein [archaeon]|jgi:3-methyladenine DNA glycosylase AlkD|nr:DNA alkylation repair protein [archaeon]MBT3577459.1 DNA alkylation repair protein [archaeon]MBT6820298.1 DNA alkylation repair protein [archaeon]MBT6955995.1 DNA alkylation repair protein [archaeon]MBT7025112.1 DNA alkylation repair protein [archaeon]
MKSVKDALKKYANPEKAKILQGFFKTGPGQYGEGDIFLGVMMPRQRAVVKKFWEEASFEDVKSLLDSEIHDERNVGSLILVEKFKRASDEQEKKKIYDFYLGNTRGINNWDIVDLSAPYVVGGYLLDKKKERKVLYDLVKSDNLWERRIAILATFAFIRAGDFGDTLKIAKLLLKDGHDLIHKAVGWMLREIGKRNQKVLEKFLQEGGRYMMMPRTMLRYAIERFEEGKRKSYLKGEI